jgi:hypothetical protein
MREIDARDWLARLRYFIPRQRFRKKNPVAYP